MLYVQSGVVDQDIDGAEPLGNLLPESDGCCVLRQIGGEDGMPAARQTGEALLGGLPVVAVVKRNTHPALCELRGDDSTDAARGTGHESNDVGVRAQRLAPSRS